MAKYPLTRIASLVNAPTSINGILDQIEHALDDTLSRTGKTPNQMSGNVDMNSNHILNLPTPGGPFEPVRVTDVATQLGWTSLSNGTVQGMINAAQLVLETRTAAAARTYDNSVTSILVLSYAAAGDMTPTVYKNVVSSGSDPRAFQSADSKWWRPIDTWTVDMTTLKAGQGVQADDDAALAAAITYANANAADGRPAMVIKYPAGRIYYHGNCATTLTASNVTFMTEARNGAVVNLNACTGAWINVGSSAASAIYKTNFFNFVFDYGNSPSTNCIFLNLQNANQVTVDNCEIKNFQKFMKLGTGGSAASQVTIVCINNCWGYSANGGVPAFDLNYGAGLFFNNCRLFVSVPTPLTKAVTNATNASPIVVTVASHGYANGQTKYISNVGGNTAANGTWVIGNCTTNTFTLTGSTGNGAYTSGGFSSDSHSTVTGTVFISCLNSYWDTLQTSNCSFERWDIFCQVNATNGCVFQNFDFNNANIDYSKRYAFYLYTEAGGVCSNISKNGGYMVSYTDDNIYIGGTGGYNDNHTFANIVSPINGRAFFHMHATGTLYPERISLENNFVGSSNTRGDGVACIYLQSGQGVQIINCGGNEDPSLPRSLSGIYVGADFDDLLITNCSFKAYGAYPIYMAPNSSASKNRLIINNRYADSITYGGYAGVAAGAWSGNDYVNKTPYRQIVTMYGGATVTGWALDGVTVANMSSGAISYPVNVTVSPGSTLHITAGTPPNITVETLP